MSNFKEIILSFNNEIKVDIKIFNKDENGNYTLPKYQTVGSVAMDLHAAESVFIPLGKTAMVSTGIAIQLPAGYEAQIRSRSGLASKGIIVMNGIGTIDEDYSGLVKVLLGNFSFTNNISSETGEFGFQINKEDRIAQICFAPIVRATWNVVEELKKTERGEGGFGSTGA